MEVAKKVLFITVLTSAFVYQASAADATPSLEELYKQAVDAVQAASKPLREALGLPDTLDQDKIVAALKKNVEKVSEQVQDYSKKLEAQISKISSEDLKKQVQKAVDQWNESVKSLRDPETYKKIEKIEENFSGSLKKILDQTQELGKSVGLQNPLPPQLQKTLEGLYEDIHKNTLKLQARVVDVITEKKKA